MENINGLLENVKKKVSFLFGIPTTGIARLRIPDLRQPKDKSPLQFSIEPKLNGALYQSIFLRQKLKPPSRKKKLSSNAINNMTGQEIETIN